MKAFLRSLVYAGHGIAYVLRTQRNARIHLVAGFLVLLAGMLWQISSLEWAVLVLALGLVFATEMLNTVAEMSVDLLVQRMHPLARAAKDTAAGAVLVAALSAVGVGLAVFGPRLWTLVFSGTQEDWRMAQQMSRRERLAATCAGQPVDRVAVALWRHFPGDDQSPSELAVSTLAYQALYDWDFIKVSPSSSFCLVDWGVADEWRGGDEGTRTYVQHAVHSAEDWERLPVLDPRAGALGGQLRCLDMVRDGVGTDVPFIQTIFSPLSQAKNLAGVDTLLVHLREHPAQVHAAMETITETTIRFVKACLPLGIAGLYYATQFATYEMLNEQEYREFGEPYDRRILAAAEECWFNMLHLHGTHVMFALGANYPVQAINWHDREAPPSIAEGQRIFAGAVSGGLARWDDMLRGSVEQVRLRCAGAIQETGGQRLILSSGCVTPVSAPWGNQRAVRAAVEA